MKICDFGGLIWVVGHGGRWMWLVGAMVVLFCLFVCFFCLFVCLFVCFCFVCLFFFCFLFFFFLLLFVVAVDVVGGGDGVAWVVALWWLWYGWWVFGRWLGLCGGFMVVVGNV